MTHTQRLAHLAGITIHGSIGVFIEQAINRQYLAWHIVSVFVWKPLASEELYGVVRYSITLLLYYVQRLALYVMAILPQTHLEFTNYLFFVDIMKRKLVCSLDQNIGMKTSRREPPHLEVVYAGIPVNTFSSWI